MYELIQAGKQTYYIQSPAKIGLFVEEGKNALLIDSGNDKEAGRRVNQHLIAQKWTLTCILNTHSNADHIGGNCFLQSRTNCQIRSTGMESAFTRYPVLEPSFLYGGFPPKALRNKFLLAQPSQPVGEASGGLPHGLEVFPLPGHYFDMLGVRTPDDVVFLADALNGAHIIQKYHVSFLYDIKAQFQTLNAIEEMEAALFIPSHGEPATDIRPLVKANRDKMLEIIDLLLSICREPASAEDVLSSVFRHYDLHMDFNQYVLVGSTLRSYLAYLLDEGQLAAEFCDNRLLWRTLN